MWTVVRTFAKEKSVSARERGNAPRRSSRIDSSRFRPENYSMDIHRRLALHTIWLSCPTTVPAGVPRPYRRAPKVEEHILRKRQCGYGRLAQSLPFSRSVRL